MTDDDLLDDFNEHRPSPRLPFVMGDKVEVLDGVYAGRCGEVDLLAFADSPIRFLVDFGDGTDELFPASSLRLVRRAT